MPLQPEAGLTAALADAKKRPHIEHVENPYNFQKALSPYASSLHGTPTKRDAEGNAKVAGLTGDFEPASKRSATLAAAPPLPLGAAASSSSAAAVGAVVAGDAAIVVPNGAGPGSVALPNGGEGALLAQIRSMLESSLDSKLGALEVVLGREIRETRASIDQISNRMSTVENEIELLREQATRDAARVRQLEAAIDEQRTTAERNYAALRAELMEEIRKAPPPAAAKPSSGWGPIPQQAGVSSRAPFVPEKVFVKGFCPYGRDDEYALSKKDAAALAASLISLLPDEWRDRVCQPNFLYRRNRQITLPLTGISTRNDVYQLVEAWNTELKSRKIKSNGFDVWIQADAPEFVKLRRRCLAKAMACVRSECNMDGATFEPDWPAGVLYVSLRGQEIDIGCVLKTGEFKWKQEGLLKVWPNLALATLVASFDAS
jgi:hypothetical protein